MTKADIARIVYERHGGISNREAARLVEIIFETIKGRLGHGEKVQITGFGSWSARSGSAEGAIRRLERRW
jgi:nucleoid DNA-binding protein